MADFDGLGREFLTGQTDENGEMHFTYLEYDGSDDLAAVHSPLSSTPLPDTAYTDLEDDFSYVYRYNPFRQRIMDKRPGCEAIYYMYDKGGRLIFSQDGEQRERGEWTFAMPDVFGRTLLTGTCTNTFYYDDYPFISIVTEATRTDATNSLYGHTLSGVTLENAVVHSVSFYDDYSFIGRNGIPSSLNYAAPPSGYGTRYTGGYKGMRTGAATARLDADGVAGYDYTAFYYDDRGRVVQTRSTNHLGGTDVEYVAYDFTGNPVKRRRVHTASGKPTQTETYTYTYDHAGRLTTVKHKLNSQAEVTLVSNTYDELGRLKSQAPHGSAANKQTYSYNIRSWLTGISGGKFTQSLHYHTGTGTPQYGGNVSSMTWKAGNETVTRGYKFAYDGLNRLTSATYGEGANISTNANRFTEKVTAYDAQGNILALQRYGQTGASSYGLLDNLTYTLDGNRVTRVDDASTATAYNNGFAFKDAVKQADEYAYDKNGNLTQDLNKNILSIEYNALNLPCEVTLGDGSTITYLYSAGGTKLRTVHTIGGVSTTTDYLGNVVYENGSPKLLLTDAGYVSLADGKYHYYLKDHQGNNRVVISSTGTVEEVNHYYPFGGVFASSGNVQPYKYNGKELDREGGLDWYDYGARHYDAALGRFLTRDPMAEGYFSTSPYAYCLNNPIFYIDPLGTDTVPVNEVDWSEFKTQEDVIALDEVSVTNCALTRFSRQVYDPVSGFWEILGYYLLGIGATYQDSNGVNYNVNPQGVITGISPRGGIAPLPGLGKISSLKHIWSRGSVGNSVRNAFRHWNDHSADFPQYQNAKQYVEGAWDFLHNPPAGTLTKIRINGDVLRYHPESNTFGIMKANGLPKTMFKPTNGIKYWHKQR